jgi:hypothetical protein
MSKSGSKLQIHVLGSSGRVSVGWIESSLSSCGGWMPRFHEAINVEGIVGLWYQLGERA